jgi:hypothetical protein
MSHPLHDGAHPRSENDRVDSRTVLLVGFGALAVFILAGAAAVGYIRHSNAVTPQATLPAEVGQDKIGLVEQQLFDSNLRGSRDRVARQAHLEGYGWTDRQGGVLHIPIAEAMAMVARGIRVPAGQGQPAPPIGAANGGVDAPGARSADPTGSAATAAPAAPSLPGGKRK